VCDRAQMLAEGRAVLAEPPKRKPNPSREATRRLDEELKHDRRSPEELQNATHGRRMARSRYFVKLRLSGNSVQAISRLTGGISEHSIGSALAEVAYRPPPGGAFMISVPHAQWLRLDVSDLSPVASLQGGVWVGGGSPRAPVGATKKGGLAHLR
jgi:hypothetical protein